MKFWFTILVIVFFASWSFASTRNDDKTIGNIQLAAPRMAGTEGLARNDNAGTSSNRGGLESENQIEQNFQLFVTPEDPLVETLATQVNRPEDAYQIASQWIYVSDKKLNHAVDKWLTPHEFLADTPYYANNPLPGKIVSDCDEKANTLVSLFRAIGIPPEQVRVVIGNVDFNRVKTGHAWVELLVDKHWLDLDPCWGPYWDDKSDKLVNRQNVPFNYYVKHSYPKLQVWGYYNDVYYLDPRTCSGNAPSSW